MNNRTTIKISLIRFKKKLITLTLKLFISFSHFGKKLTFIIQEITN